MVHSAGHKAIQGTTLHRLPTYKVTRAGRFTNAPLAMLVMALLDKYLHMRAGEHVKKEVCISAERGKEGTSVG